MRARKPKSHSATGKVGMVIISLLVAVGVGTLALFAISSAGTFSSQDYFMEVRQVALYSGTASSSTSRGSAALTVEMTNPGGATGIESISLGGNGFSSPAIVFQCSNKTACFPIHGIFPFSAPLAAEKVTYFETNTTAFYPSGEIIAGDSYSYVLSFFNGQSVSGVLTAQPSQSLPAGPIRDYYSQITTSSYSSSCTYTPYTTTQTVNSSGTIETAIVTIYSSC